jgi:GNAT superfamily N-acetyltransferase
VRSDADLKIEPLRDHHDRKSFSCGVEPLDRYFQTQSSQDVRRRLAACFVLIGTDPTRTLGFYTLSAASIALDQLPPAVARKLPRYPLLPATLMGRLAVDSSHRSRGYGELLLLDAFARTLQSEIATFAFIVDAKDAAAENFYRQYGFDAVSGAGRRLFLTIADVAKLFAQQERR